MLALPAFRTAVLAQGATHTQLQIQADALRDALERACPCLTFEPKFITYNAFISSDAVASLSRAGEACGCNLKIASEDAVCDAARLPPDRARTRRMFSCAQPRRRTHAERISNAFLTDKRRESANLTDITDSILHLEGRRHVADAARTDSRRQKPRKSAEQTDGFVFARL